MATMAEIEQFNLRLTSEQKGRLERLARASGVSLNQYIALLIDAQYEAESDTLEKIELLRAQLTQPRVVSEHKESYESKKNRRRAA